MMSVVHRCIEVAGARGVEPADFAVIDRLALNSAPTCVLPGYAR